jgi:hypothetical protein
MSVIGHHHDDDDDEVSSALFVDFVLLGELHVVAAVVVLVLLAIAIGSSL